jgi:transcriptional regulator with XRE-family HTH domain
LELKDQIKKFRASLNLSQEELAEKVYVTRQSISNWENGKNYPDIHSLILLSALFEISLDQLIKGDIETMKKEIGTSEIKAFNYYGTIFGILLLITVVSFVPLVLLLKGYGIAISAALFATSFFFAMKVEKFKKDNEVHTYKEIVAFVDGKRLDEIEKHQEFGKRPYQKILLALGSAVFTLVICAGMFWLIEIIK